MFQPGEVVDRSPGLYGKRILVDTRVHALITYDLCAIEPSVTWREGYLDVHLPTAWIIAGM